VKYIYLVILFLLISSLSTPVNNYAQQEEFKLYLKQKQEMSMTMSMSAQGDLSGSYSTSVSINMILLSTYNITVTGERVKGVVTFECLSYSIDVSSDSTRSSTSIPISECNEMLHRYLGSASLKIDRSIKDHYSQAYQEALQQIYRTLHYIGSYYFDIKVNVEFNGIKTYKEYKVAEYSYDFNMNYSFTFGYLSLSLTGGGEGVEYVYVGIPVVLYGEAEVNYDIKSSHGNISGAGSFKVKIETLEADLPRETPYGYVKHDKYTILAGGFPGSKIVVKGDRESKTISARNEGVAPGYVVVIYQAPSSSSLSSIDLRLGNSELVNAINQNVEVYVLNPGEEQIISLPFKLVDNVNFATSYTPGFDWLLMLIIIAIVVIIVLIPVYLIVRLRRRQVVTSTPITEQPPSPPPQQPPSPPPPA